MIVCVLYTSLLVTRQCVVSTSHGRGFYLQPDHWIKQLFQSSSGSSPAPLSQRFIWQESPQSVAGKHDRLICEGFNFKWTWEWGTFFFYSYIWYAECWTGANQWFCLRRRGKWKWMFLHWILETHQYIFHASMGLNILDTCSHFFLLRHEAGKNCFCDSHLAE